VSTATVTELCRMSATELAEASRSGHGIPFTVKGNIDLAGTPTTHGIKALAAAYLAMTAQVWSGCRPPGRKSILQAAVILVLGQPAFAEGHVEQLHHAVTIPVRGPQLPVGHERSKSALMVLIMTHSGEVQPSPYFTRP